MNFHVVWRSETLDALADIYVAADTVERARIATGVEVLNRQLAIDPHAEGESRDGNIRIAFPDLLVVRFRVENATATVRVVGVRRYGR